MGLLSFELLWVFLILAHIILDLLDLSSTGGTARRNLCAAFVHFGGQVGGDDVCVGARHALDEGGDGETVTGCRALSFTRSFFSSLKSVMLFVEMI